MWLVAMAGLLIGCASEPNQTADTGTLVVQASFVGGAPKVGQNVLSVQVADASGTAIAGAQVTVDPQMPAHGHGASEVPVVTDNGGGSYSASPVTLAMKGHWQITVTVAHEAETGATVLDVTL